MTKFLSMVIGLLVLINMTPRHEANETSTDAKKLKALIIDGENNHGVWPMTTMMMKDYLEQTGLFVVDIERTAYTWQGPHYDKGINIEPITDLLNMYPIEQETKPVEEPRPDPDFRPNFKKYDVIINNMGWKASTWQPEVQMALDDYINNGGGMVIVHAANNSWGDWDAYNQMIGLGGWGGRGQHTGPYVYYDLEGDLQHDTGPGNCGSHGPQQEYVVTTRAPEHPIMKGLPTRWMHARDELYEKLRGPAKDMTVLATAYSHPELNRGTNRHEPMLMTVNMGKGRVFHTAMGHMDYSMECVGFITTFQRGAEWAASAKVTQKVPSDFPEPQETSSRIWSGRVSR